MLPEKYIFKEDLVIVRKLGISYILENLDKFMKVIVLPVSVQRYADLDISFLNQHHKGIPTHQPTEMWCARMSQDKC